MLATPPHQTRSTIISVRLSNNELARMEGLAKEYDMTVSEIMLLAFRLYLKREN